MVTTIETATWHCKTDQLSIYGKNFQEENEEIKNCNGCLARACSSSAVAQNQNFKSARGGGPSKGK